MARGGRDRPPIDSSLRRLAVVFRLVGAAWLCVLAASVLGEETPGRRGVILATVAIAVVWAGFTWWLAVNRRDRFLTNGWLVADGVVAVWIAVSPFVADSTHKFFGGYPMTWVYMAAYVGGVAYALPAGGLLAFTQIAGAFDEDRAITSTLSDITVFVISALLLGWAVNILRETDARRHTAVRELEAERRERRLADERAEIGAHLHDSVLQTLALIQQDAQDENVRRLARTQDRELRSFIDRMSSPYDRSFAADLKATAHEVEESRSGEVEVVVVGDCELDTRLDALIKAAREAIVNAVKYGGGSKVSVFAEVRDGAVTVSVRDRGAGFDVESALAGSQGLAQSVVARMQRHGGSAAVTSDAGRGTEVNLRLPREVPDE